ncbi:mediator of RNA polymerase II transcription subunit 16-like [Eriocheir sinensis]|uniref:mediator of RNA polymerase II transcription subunit 16-like n=1 Tax=Eriocheir sinensis TaxID=95602 RepID=UPI0021CAB51F|nr:mediator of RNA polymerase II transcription subunit 16-like [Eriocheir sinensis]
MELFYSVSEKRSLDDTQQTSLYTDGGACTVSSKSLVAFTRMTTRQDSYRHRIPICTVCVMDLNTPNEPHVVMESVSKVIFLSFSSDGSQLLVVLSMGRVHLFTKGAGLHHWTSSHTCDWDGEDILHISFFHGGIRSCVQSGDVNVHAPYIEKFMAHPHKPTLVDLGQCAMNGFFAVSASGLLLVCVLNHEGAILTEKKIVLGRTRDNFAVATAAVAPSGHIHVATWKPEMIKCWRAELKLVEQYKGGKGDIKVSVQAAQSFCPAMSNTTWHTSTKSEGLVQVTSLRYTEQEDPTSLLVALTMEKPVKTSPSQQSTSTTTAGSVSYLVRRYQLQEQQRPLLKAFKPMPDSVGIATKEWFCMGEWISSSPIVALSTATRHLLPGSTGAHLPFIITAATADAYIYAINRDNMQQLSSHNLLNTRGGVEDAPVSKRVASERQVVSLTHTWSGMSLLALDSMGSLHFITLIRPSDIGPQWAISLILLLEFALVSGSDWWDLLVSTPHSSIPMLTDKLSENFQQHSTPITQHLHIRFLVMKTSMLRLLGSQQQKAIESRIQAQLTATQQLFRTLRPVTGDVATSEKNISVTIQNYLENRASLDLLDIEKSLDHLCSSMNVKDCQVDPGQLQNLQPLIQFAADLALFILFMLAQNSKFELARDAKIVQSLRELLFVARLWYRQNKLVLPQMFHKTQSVDVWAQIYKLLTRVAQILPGEPDSALIDECVLLETQVVCRELPLHVPPRGVLADIASSASMPLQYEYGHGETNNLNTTGAQPRILEGALPPLPLLDPLHYHYIAPNEPKFNCTRCCSVRASWWGDSESVWDHHWASNCICSGHWAQPPASPPKAA